MLEVETGWETVSVKINPIAKKWRTEERKVAPAKKRTSVGGQRLKKQQDFRVLQPGRRQPNKAPVRLRDGEILKLCLKTRFI